MENFFNVLVALVFITIVFGGLFLLFKISTTIKKNNGIPMGKTISSFPISLKTSGHIIQLNDKFYLCCEGSGIIELEGYSVEKANLETTTFQKTLSKELETLGKKLTRTKI